MRSLSVGTSSRVTPLARAVITVMIAVLSAFSIASHFVPVELAFKALVIGVPCVTAGSLFVYLVVSERRWPASRVSLKTLARCAVGTATYVSLVLGATGIVSDFVGNSSGCPSGVSGSCYKTASWAIRDGGYYRLWPYDAEGNGITGAPWEQITENEYISGAGADFRQADGFGIFAAGFAYLLVVTLDIRRRQAGSGRGSLEVRRPLPEPDQR